MESRSIQSKTQTIMMDKNYFIFLIKDILERFKSYDKQVNKDNILSTLVYIPTTCFCYDLEHISLKKQGNKINIKSIVLVSSNITNYSEVDYIFLNEEKEIIGLYPQIENEETREVIIADINNYYNDHEINHNYFELINWEIMFEDISDTDKVNVKIINMDLSSIGITKNSFKEFIHKSISDKIITEEKDI